MNDKHAKVLLVEDDPLYAQAIRGLFMAKGVAFELEWVGNLAQGLERLSEGDIDLVLLDLALPDSEGPETFHRIHRQAPDLPIIVLTATNDDTVAIQSMQAGAQDFLVKGEINRHLLTRAMRYAIERRRSEVDLRESRRLLQEIADVTPEVIAIYDLEQQRNIYVNRQLSFILGYNTGELQQRTLRDLVEPDDYARLEAVFAELRTAPEGVVLDLEYRAHHANGGQRWLHSEHTVFTRDEQGRARQILITTHDITERKEAEEALRQSEERYRDLVENGGLYVGMHDAEGRILSVNRNVLDFIGLSADQLSGRNIGEFLLVPAHDKFAEYLQTVLTQGHARGTVKFLSPRGRVLVIEYDNTLRLNGRHGPIVRCIGRDVTAREEAAAAVRAGEDRYRDLVENSGLLIGTHDVEGRFVSVNQGALKFIGVERKEEVVGRHIVDLLAPEVRDQFEAYLSRIVAKGHAQGTMLVVTPGGGRRILEYDNSLRQDAPGQPVVIRFIARDVTERRHNERKIRESEERFRLIAEYSTDVIGRYSLNGDTLYVSPAIARILGYDPEERLGRSIFDLFHPDDVEKVRRAHLALTAGSGTQSVIFRYLHKDGHYVWCESNARLIRHPETGEPQEIQSITRDVTERRLAEEAVRESEERYRDLFENANDIVFTLDLEGRFTSLNEAGEGILGYTRAELANCAFTSIVVPCAVNAVNEVLTRKLAGERQSNYEAEVVAKNGRRMMLEVSSSPITKDGQPAGVQGIARDITERKRTEGERARLIKQLEAERTLFQAVLRQMPAGVIIAEAPSERVVLANEQAARILHRSVQEIRNGFRYKGYHLDGKRYQAEEWPLARALKEGEAVTGEEMFIMRSDGALATISADAAPIRNREGRIVAGVVAFSDITERKMAEEQIREQAALLNSAQDAIAVQDLEGRITFWNRGAERLYGWSSAEVIDQRLDELINDPSPQSVRWAADIKKQLDETGEWKGELRQRTRAKKEIIVESRCTLVRDDAQKPKSILVINTDITSRKQLETQVLRMQRMESIGSLASGIAHDLNNALAPILMALHTLQQRFTDDNSRHWLSLVRKSAERSRDLVDQVLTFARGAAGRRLQLYLDELINDLANILQETLPKNITIIVSLPKNLWPIIGDPTQVHQVLMNLCINARDAMLPPGGQMFISAENADLTIDDVWTHEGVKPGRFVRITVTDSGTGIPPEVMERIFEPFYTTKELGQGSGLGLSTASGIVRGHGGYIGVVSTIGKGSQFIVCLPADESAIADLAAQPEAAAADTNGALVLAVDDEETLLEVTKATLEDAGYRVLAVGDGTEALDLFRVHHAEIQLVLTDLAMPGMDGLTAGREMRRIDPAVKIIATSGLRSQQNIEQANQAGVKAVLWKPYTADDLLDKIAEVIRN